MTIRKNAPIRIRLPNGLTAVMYPPFHMKMQKILKTLANYASGGVNETNVERKLNIVDFTRFKPTFGGRKILKINFAGTTVYLVLVSTMQDSRDLTIRVNHHGFRTLFAFVMYFVFNDEVCYYSTTRAKILRTAIEQNLDPNLCALMEG